MKNKNIKDYGESSNFSAIQSFSQPGQPYKPNEYAKNMLLSLTEQATDLITKIMTISTRILELKKALA